MLRRVLGMMALVGVLGHEARAQVKLEYKMAEGTTRRIRVAPKVEQTLSIAGMDVKRRSDSEVVVRMAAGKRRDDGTLPVEITNESIRLNVSVNGVEAAVDSAEKEPKVDVPGLQFLGPLVKAYAGTSYTLVFDPKGALKAVEGVEKNLERANDMPEQAASDFKARFDVDRIRREFEEQHATFPDGLVREGEPWERTETSPVAGGQTLTFKKRYEYKGTVTRDGKALDKIDVKSLEVAFRQAPDAKTRAKVTKSDLKVESSEGTILFDREAGVAVERREKDRIVGDLTLTIEDKEYPAKLDLMIETTMTTETSK